MAAVSGTCTGIPHLIRCTSWQLNTSATWQVRAPPTTPSTCRILAYAGEVHDAARIAGHREFVWYRAQSHPVVGRARRLLHNDPAQSWTVASLPARTGVSRAALARSFTELVGEPPMSDLTEWRLSLAADLLREPGTTTVSEVAHRVGYGSSFALSTAFKRIRGVSLREHRLAAR
jgi:AraC-like DNA-binding protein